MKKIIIILLSVLYAFNASSQACCPEFAISFKRDLDCARPPVCMGGATGNTNYTASMCKYSTATFLITPNLPGYTYSWTVTGGTPSATNTNPINITWGGGSTGTISVTITSADGSCVKTINETICLRDAPQASFTFTPNNACAGTPVMFTNTSVGGASVSWNFGDGSTAGNVNTVTHTYASSGVYNVTITVSTDTALCRDEGTGQPNPKPCCGCVTTYTQQVTVIAGTPLTIIPKNCVNQCLCVGDKQEYCASAVCGTYNWTVSGGNIISGAGTQCITVQWTGPYPTSITLNTNCTNPCGTSATLNVPVLVNNIPISPNNPNVCVGSTQNYSLPAMPGAFYTWTVVGGTIAGPSINTNTISVIWNTPGAGQVSCTYSNPLKKNCNGSSTLNVTVKPVLNITGPTQSCVGCTGNFNAPAPGATWSISTGGPAPTPASGTFTSLAFTTAGTYTLTATNTAFCNSPQTHTIVVAPRPVLSIAPTAVTVCPGTPVKFVATSNVTNTPITWTLPAGATMMANTGPQMDTAVVQFTVLPATITASQNCTYNLNCSQATATATISKPAAPAFSTGLNTNPCIDQTYTYSISNYVPGITYTWSISSGLGTIVTGQGSGSVQILWHGNTSVANAGTITVSNCGGSVSLPVTVKLPPVVTISQSGSCLANGITLTSSGPGPWQWSTGQTTQSITVTQAGSYTVTVGGTGCTGTKTIIVPASPYYVNIIPPCTVSSCSPGSISVPFTVVTNSPGTSCQWYFIPVGSVTPVPAPGGNICGNYTGTQLGTYFYVITLPSGCKDTSNRIRVPEDVNLCCANAACNSIPANSINFTHSGCAPTNFTGTFTLPSGWSTGTLPVTYCYGDGHSTTGPSLNATHQYEVAGLYNACIIRKIYKPSGTPGINDTCCVSNCHDVLIPVVAKFDVGFNCNTGLLNMTSTSTFYPSPAGAVYTWTYSGPFTGTLTNGPNQTITPTASGSYIITLSITLAGCTSTYSLPINVVLPTAPITATPNPSCDGSPVYFSTVGAFASYNWQFGDNNFSYAAAPQHIYPAPGTYNVTLTAVTPDGCIVTSTKQVTIQPKPIVTIIPPAQTVCPGSPATLTASVNPNGNTMCSSYNYQWFNGNTAVGPASPSNTLTTSNYGTYHVVVTGSTPSCNCVVTSNTAVVNWYPQPVANIQGRSTVCLNGGTGTVTLTNSVTSYTSYNWTANSGAVSFSPNNAIPTTVTVNAPGNYQVYLEVVDANGCKAYDTLCIYASNRPQVSITPPPGWLCAGNMYTLNSTVTPATAPPLGYGYLWNNGLTTPSITVSSTGVYSVTVTDRNTGCSGTSNPVTINPSPNVTLFPTCCDTLCDTTTKVIIPPLPIGVGGNVCATYTIVWLDNGIPISPQPTPCNMLPIASLGLGAHKISVTVTLNGCPVTSGEYNLFIKKCNCDCEGSHWGEIVLTPGEAPPADPKAKPKTTAKANVPGQIFLACNQGITLECNKPYTLNASYICKDTSCPAKVTYSLQPPSGPAITGTMPPAFSFTPTQNGVYVLTLIGWCDGKPCDTCVIDITVNCSDCCKDSKWKETPWYYFKDDNKPLDKIKIDCAKETVIYWNGANCKKLLVVGAAISCPPNCTSADSVFVYDNANTLVVSGPAPLTIPVLPNGTYTIVFNGYCGGKLCLTCKAILKVECDEKPCNCEGSHWGETFITINNQQKAFDCKNSNSYNVKCNQPITVSAMYICADPNCAGTVNYTLQPPSGMPVTGTMPPPFTFVPSLAGTYTLTLTGMCGSTVCNTCVLKFTTDCKPPDCCPKELSVKAGTPVYTPVASPASTIVGNTFTISGLGTNNITEVRAEVVSYSIADNYDKECLKCVNLPFTWASMASANNINTAPPKITMFGGATVPSFSGTGAGAYQNPREIIWNNGSNLNSPPLTNIGIKFILPPAPGIDCCELKGKICVKFTFRDKDCKECEAIACFEFLIRKK